MAPVKVTFSDSNAQPPVFVAGAFTEWQPVEIESVQQADGSYVFEKTFDLSQGSYQYKFRLGLGDWWVCDSQAPLTRDDSGNENNLLVVEKEPEVASQPESKATTPAEVPAPVAAVNGTYKAIPTAASQQPKETTPTSSTVESAKEQPVPYTNGNVKSQALAHHQVTSPSEPEKPVKVANVEKTEPSPATLETSLNEKPTAAHEAVKQPVSKSVDGSASPAPAAKEVNGKQSSDSSLLPKEKAPEKSEQEPKKLGWFARIFLCGSSGKIILAAGVVIVPILAAYIIQK